MKIWSGKKVEVHLRDQDAYQLDGDVEGQGRVLVAEVDPGSLRIRAALPHRADGAPPKHG